MTRVVLLSDSIFDNAAYVGRGGTVVIGHLRQGAAPHGWSLDGATAEDVPAQVATVKSDGTTVCAQRRRQQRARLTRSPRCRSACHERPGGLHSTQPPMRRVSRQHRRAFDALLVTVAWLVVSIVYKSYFLDAELPITQHLV